MKKHVIFILLFALPFISKSQVIAKQVKLSIQNNTLIAVDNSNNVLSWAFPRFSIVDVNPNTQFWTVAVPNANRVLYFNTVVSFEVNGAAAPLTFSSITDSLKTYSVLVGTIGGGGSGGGSSDASAANQTVGNNLSTTIRDSSIVVPNIVRVTRDRVKTTNDSLAALNNISREIRDKATTSNGLTDVQLRATPVPVIDQKTIDTLNVSANVQRVTSARIKDGNDSLNALNNISRQIRDKVNNDQKNIDTIAAGNNVARQTRDIFTSKDSTTQSRQLVYVGNLQDSTKSRGWVNVNNFDAIDTLKTTRAVISVANLPTQTTVAGTAATRAVLIGGVFNTTPPTLTNGQGAALQVDATGKLQTVSNLGATVYVQSTGNNTAAQLASGATFTGTIESALSYPQAIISLRSDVAVTLFIDKFSDAAGTIQYATISYTLNAGQGFNAPVTLSGSFYRIRITNNATITSTTLFAETWLGIMPATPNLTSFGNLPVEQLDVAVTGQPTQTAIINNILTPIAGTNATDVLSFKSGSVQVASTGTGGTFIFEGSNDGVNFVAMGVFNKALGNATIINTAITATASQITYIFPIDIRFIRLRIVTAITGGSIQAFSRYSQHGFQPLTNNVTQSVSTSLATFASQSGAWLVGQTPITQVNDIASAAITTTTSTAAITPTNGVSFVSDINVTAVTGTTPTMQVNIEQSYDGGTTWELLYEYPVITIAGKYTSPRLPISGNRVRYVQTLTGTTPSFTRSIVRTQGNDDVTLAYRSRAQSVTTTITTGGTAQTLLASNASRQGFEIQNNSTADLRFSIGGTASATVGFVLTAGSSYSSPATRTTTLPITIFGATTGQQFTFIQY